MIDKVVVVGFKGLELSIDLKRLNLAIGPMGCGKTSISDTIELVTNGRIPGAGKTNQAIMDAFASDDKMFLGASVNNQFFERRFIRAKSGKVTQKFRAGNTLVTKEDFTTAFAVAGRPVLFNLNQFISLSDEKKINEVFKLYPPRGDVFSIHEKIDEATESINTIRALITTTEGLIEKLTVDQAKAELPPGTLAEIQQELGRNEAEITLCSKNINRQTKIEAEAEAKEAQEKREAETKQEEPKEAPRTQLGGPVTHTARNSEDFQEPSEPVGTLSPGKDYPTVAPDPAPKYGTKEYAKEMVKQTDNNDAAMLIQDIIDTMDKAGCSVCAAKLVAKQAIKKLRG